MLSKEQKLKYGEILRQQMKDKQQKKKFEDKSKRGQPVYAVPHTQSDRIVLADPGLLYNDPKDDYVKRLQNQDYNPFGKSGGGAPNRKLQQNNGYAAQNSPSIQGKMPYSTSGNKSVNYINPNSGQFIGQQRQHLNVPQHNNNMPSVKFQGELPYQQSLQQYHHPQSQQYPEMPVYQPQRRGNHYIEPNQQHHQTTLEPQYPGPNRKIPIESYNYEHSQPQYEYRGQQRPTVTAQQQPPYQIQERQRVKTLDNEDMHEMYKRGGRNLLKLQNETMNEHLVKQKQKLQMQAFLKQQIQEAERRKQLQKQKIKQEELQEERKNRQYIEEQNRKLRDDQRKKVQERQRNIDQNLRNVEKRKELEQEAKGKLQRERRLGVQNERKRQQMMKNSRATQHNPPLKQTPRVQSKLRKFVPQESSSQINSTSSQNPTYGNGFNTKVSKQFFQKERQKEPQKYKNQKKIELFSAQIQKIRHQINNQGEMFQKQIQKIKRQADQAQSQKMRAQLQVQKLKLQLQKKNKESELKLYDALKRNDPHKYQQKQVDNYDSLSQLTDHHPISKPHHQNNQKQHPPHSPKMSKNNKVYQHYQQPQRSKIPIKESTQHIKYYNNNYQQSNLSDSLAMTLDGQSKKIPLSLPTNSKLTLSNIGNYGKEEFMFSGNTSKPKVNKIYQNEFIREEQEYLNVNSRVKSRKHNRQQYQELDRLVDNENKKWEMSTVNDDITKEIQDLLKKKESYPNQHYSEANEISQAGRGPLSRGAIPYQGANLNSLNSQKNSTVSYKGTVGTVDIDKIYDRNDARLRQLKALGVETINTNNDEDLNRLNDLLKNYY